MDGTDRATESSVKVLGVTQDKKSNFTEHNQDNHRKTKKKTKEKKTH